MCTETIKLVHKKSLGGLKLANSTFADKSAGFSIVPVARCSACEIAWHKREKTTVAVYEAVPVVAIVPVLPYIVQIPAL